MTIYIVTRRACAVEWLRSRGYDGTAIPQWGDEDIARLQPGDIVIGVLPVLIIRDILNSGARFILPHLPGIAFGQRGQELTPDEMEAAGACLHEIVSLEIRDVRVAPVTSHTTLS